MDVVLNWSWQGCAVALATVATLRLLNGARANVRYAVCWTALLLIAVLPIVPELTSAALAGDAPRLASEGAVVMVPDDWWTSGTVMAGLWAMWLGIHTLKFVRAMAVLRGARARSQAFPAALESRLPHWRRVRSTGRRSSLVVSDAVQTAAVLGGGAPVIAVAPSLLTSLDADDLDRVLVHEWSHVQRRDDVVNLLQVVVCAVVGWHPAAWWLDRRLRVEREIACDETTIEVTGSAKSYAACLVHLAGLKGRERVTLAPAALTVSGLRTRVTRIVGRHSFLPPMLSRGLAAASVATLCLMSVTVAELALVKTTVLALPFESLRSPGPGTDVVAPLVKPAVISRNEPSQTARNGSRPASPGRAPVAEESPANVPAPVDFPRHPAPAAEPAGASIARLSGIEALDEISSAVPDAPTPVAGVPPQLTHAAVESSRSVWSAAAGGGVAIGNAAADGGVAIGRKSKQAGVKTAGFFNRLARNVAGSF